MLSRTDRCKHALNISCSENVIHSFYKMFITVFSMKLIANNITYLGKWKKLFQNLTSYKSNRDNVMFTLFLALMNSAYKLILCTLRRYIKSDKVIAPIAGFIAGLFSILDQQKRRQFLTCILLSRFFDSAVKVTVDRQVAPVVPYFEVYTWFLCAITQQYVCSYEVDCLNKGVHKFLNRWSAFIKNDLLMQE
jgi:hypothetical protein